MRSLTFKLVLAFLLTSVAGVALASVFIRQSVTREFDNYVLAEQRARFIEDAGAYYTATGSWAGIERWLRYQAPISPVGGPPGPGDPRRPPQRQRFALADSSGRVVLPLAAYPPGRRIPPAELAAGTPITINGQVVGTVITPDLGDFRNVAEERYLARIYTALGIAAVVMVGIALALGVLLARVITRPVRELTAAAGKIAGGDLAQRVPVRSREELGVLAAQFNHMSADLAHATQLRRQMTADVAHDLRTPLTVIAGYLEALRDQVLKPTPERFAAMYDETRLLLHLVEDLHTLSLVDAGELALECRPCAPRQLLERVAETYRDAADRQGVTLCVEVGADVPELRVDVEQMARVLSNLVSNALRYTPSGGRVGLAACPDAGHVRLVVADTGTGIAPEHLPNIFERFYRADSARRQETGGSGLGLAIVRSIVEAHGGQIGVESTLGRGTTFTIML